MPAGGRRTNHVAAEVPQIAKLPAEVLQIAGWSGGAADRQASLLAFAPRVRPSCSLLAFPLAILARWAWVVKNLFTRVVDLNKQPVPSQGMLSGILLSIFLKEIEATRPETSRSFGLSYYACLKKKA